MSKMDDLRAMREARYAQRTQGRAPGGAPAKTAPTAPTAPRRPQPPVLRVVGDEPAPVEAAAEPGAADALCGHRSMNGRTCTREAGHAAKSHRYS